MKKIGYFSCIIFFMFLVGCSNNKKENGNLLNASSFPLILTTIIEKEEDLTKGSIFFNKDKTMTLEKEYLVNPNNEDINVYLMQKVMCMLILVVNRIVKS